MQKKNKNPEKFKSAAIKAKIYAFKLISLQLLIVALLAFVWGFVQPHDALSSALGGLIVIIPNLFFAQRFFSKVHQKSPQRIIATFYAGEFIKLLLSVSLIIIVFKTMAISIIPFLCGFMGAHMGFWLAPLIAVSNARVQQ